MSLKPIKKGEMLDSARLKVNEIISAVEDVLEAGSPVPFGFVQALPALTWIVKHDLGRRPMIQVFSAGGVEVEGSVTHLSDDQVRLDFNQPQAGSCLCR